MNTEFFERPILNSPYEYPGRHWELDESGQPTSQIIDRRRRVSFITPIPKPKKRGQREIVFDEAAEALETGSQQYDLMEVINDLRRRVDAWRAIPDPGKWRVTPETARLLQHWRGHRFGGIRPFFCQVEAVETVIWLTEVASGLDQEGRRFLDHLAVANEQSNPGLARLALKLATGAGKTTVMAMLIAWQTVNAVRRPGSRRFTRGFLVVTPGLTIRDRLRVLQPNDPDSYYRSRELVPGDMLGDLDRAKIVITNYHAFMRRETLAISRGGRSLLEGRGREISTRENTGQMFQRVMPDLMGMKNILALNDEAHHCYREKPPDKDEEGPLKGDNGKEAKKNREAARVWMSGLQIIQRKLGIGRVIDLSATPFFLRGSGYAEGTLFPWTVNDFSLMDAIESGIVKLPRVPVADQFQVKLNGVDVFHPNTGEVHSDGADGIAGWFIDTDYDEESFFVRHAYFLGAADPYKALKTTLKAEINHDAWATLRSDLSRPFDRPSSGRIAVKVINHLGDEVMKVFRV